MQVKIIKHDYRQYKTHESEINDFLISLKNLDNVEVENFFRDGILLTLIKFNENN